MTTPSLSPASESWGRFTLRGGRAVEALLREIAQEAVDALTPVLKSERIRALCLIGGYGRGEGGVETDPETGLQRPHNNLDLLVIARRGLGTTELAALKGQMDTLLAPLIARYGITIDVGATTEAKLSVSPCLVMWHDMRFGHKTLWGDADYLPGLTRFAADAIPAWDARNLLTNRATLLVINDALIAARGGIERLSESERRTVVRHSVKAIIGYGDALLFSYENYHWSYAEKQRRMRSFAPASQDFRSLYESAMEFRFEPYYAQMSDQALTAWLQSLQESLPSVHLECERRRLDAPALTWRYYLEAALRHAVASEEPPRPRVIVRRLYHLLKSGTPGGVRLLSPTAQLGFRCGGGYRGALPCLLPAVAYGGAAVTPAAEALLGIEPGAGTPDSLRCAYLRLWGTYGDINFRAVLGKLNLNVFEPVSTFAIKDAKRRKEKATASQTGGGSQ